MNRTYQDARDMRKQRELRQFYANINTEIASCTQDEDESCDYRRPNHQPQNAAADGNGFAESRATNKDDDEGSPARLLEQLLAS